MRALLLTAALSVGACSALYDAHDLHGLGGDPTAALCHPPAGAARILSYAVKPLLPPEAVGRLASADLDGDGRFELLAASLTSNTIFVFHARATGFDAAADRLPTPAPAGQLLLRDLDRDGKIDFLAAIPARGSVLIFRGHGDGRFADPTEVQVASQVSQLAVADLDRDGLLDLVSTSGNGDPPSLSRGLRDGSFGPAAPAVLQPIAAQLSAIADLDGDGRLDLVFAQDTKLTVFLARGGYATGSVYSDDTQGFFTATLLVDDYTGDGRPDVVIADNNGDSHVSVFANAGDGTLAAPVFYPGGMLQSGAVSATSACDLDGDGRLDLAYGRRNGSNILIARGSATGLVQGATATTDDFVVDLAVGDFDGDGLPDLAQSGPDRLFVALAQR